MNKRTIALVVPYTKSGKILLQKRSSISKWGEEWSFWGGGVEKGETSQQAARREIKEELDFDIGRLTYVGRKKGVLRNTHTRQDWELTDDIYVTEVIEDKAQFTVHEGDGLGFFTMAQARKLMMAPKMDNVILDTVERYLKNNNIKT